MCGGPCRIRVTSSVQATPVKDRTSKQPGKMPGVTAPLSSRGTLRLALRVLLPWQTEYRHPGIIVQVEASERGGTLHMGLRVTAGAAPCTTVECGEQPGGRKGATAPSAQSM